MKEKTKELKIEKLLSDISAAKEEMNIARENFNYVYKASDVDIYIYKLRSAETKYTKLLKEFDAIS